MSLSTLILLLVFSVNLGLLVFVIINKNKQHVRPFFWMLFLLFLWQTTEILNLTVLIDGDPRLLLLGVRTGLLPVLFIAPSFVWLSFSLFDKWKNFSFWAKFFWWIPAIVMSPFVFTSHNLEIVVVSSKSLFYEPGNLYWFFAGYFVILMSYGLYVLVKNRPKANAIVKKQIDHIFVATALTALAGVLFSVILPILGNYDFYYLGVNSTVIFTIILSYALFRHRFFDLRILLYRAILDLLRLFITGGAFYLLFLVLHKIIGVDFSIGKNILMFLVFIGLAAPLLFRLVNRVVVALLVNPTDDIKNSTRKTAEILRSSRDLSILFSRLSKEINKIIDFKELFVYLSKKDRPEVFYQVFPVGERLLNKKDSHLLQFLKKRHCIVNRAEIDYLNKSEELSKELSGKNIDIALPIFYNRQLLGILIIDIEGRLPSIQELHFLGQVNKYLDIAVGSLLLHQQDMADRSQKSPDNKV